MRKKWGMRILFLTGFLLCCFPFVNNGIERRHQADVVATYQKAVQEQEDQLADILENAQKYNDLLFQMQGAVVDEMDLLSDENYNRQLDVSGTGVMGSLDIPKINVNLPIYHGTGEDALSNGIGHLQGTSLPAGGENTHSILSGHRGLPTSKLLVRLDEMKKGDFFFVRTCNQTLAYKVIEIQVVEPEDVSCLDIQPGKDLMSLVTCTPYGINTHRLIVTGSRVEYEESAYRSIEEAIPSGREILFTVLPFIFAAWAMVLHRKDRRRMKREIKKR